MGGTVWEESSLTEGVEGKKELAGDAKPVSLRCDVDVVAQGGQDIIHRWEWRARLGSWHLKLCFFFTDSSQKYRCFSIVFFFLFFFFHAYVWKGGKSPRLLYTSAAAWKWCCCMWEIWDHQDLFVEKFCVKGWGMPIPSHKNTKKGGFRKEQQRWRKNVKTSSNYWLRSGDNIIMLFL